MSRKRRAAAALLSVAACLGPAAGCAGATGPPTAPGTQPWPTPAGAGTLTVTILTGTDTSSSAGNEPVNKDEPGMYAELADWWNTYEAPVTHIRVALAQIQGGATAEHSEMLADAGAGDASYDIYNLDNEWVPEFAAAGYIRSLDGRLPAGGFLPQPLASGEYGGRRYAAPFTTDVGLLYYRKDRVSESQVRAPGSFSALIRLADETDRPGAGSPIGYAGQLADYEGLTVNLLEIIHSDDRDAFAADGAIRDANAVTQGLQQLYDAMYTTGVIPPAELSYTESQAFTAFATGKALFMRNWPIYYELLTSASTSGGGLRASRIGVRPLPFPSVLGGQDLAISAGSKNPGAALQVIRYLTSPEAEECLFAVGGFPATRRGSYAPGARLPTGYGSVRGHPLCGTSAGASPEIGPVILAAIGMAFLRPRTRYYTEFSAIIQHEVPLFLRPAPASLGNVVGALETGLGAAASGRGPPASPVTGTPLNALGAGPRHRLS